MNIITRKRTFSLLFLFAFSVSLALPLAFPVSGDTTTEKRVEFSFNQVRSGMSRVKIYDSSGTTLIDNVDGTLGSWSKPGYTQLSWAISNPFNVNVNGTPITTAQAEQGAPVISQTRVGNTLIMYRRYYYAVDFLVYTSVILPSDTVNYVETLSMPGWKSTEDPVTGDNQTVDDTRNYLLVAEEGLPAGYDIDATYSNNVGWWLNSKGFGSMPKTDPRFYTWHWSYGPFLNWEILNLMGGSQVNEVATIRQQFEYKATSLDKNKIFSAVGGDVPLVVVPEINMHLVPFVTDTININGTDVEIYAVLSDATVISTSYGTVKNAYTSESSKYASQITQAFSEDVKEKNMPGYSPAYDTKNDKINEMSNIHSVNAIPETSTNDEEQITSYTQASPRGVAMPMYFSNASNQQMGNFTSSLQLIKDAPDEVLVKPRMTIQPSWDIKAKKVNCQAKWVTYYDPRSKDLLNNPIFTDQVDVEQYKTTSVNPITSITVNNNFIIERIRYSVIVSTIIDNYFVFTTTGLPIDDPRYYGNGTIIIGPPGGAGGKLVTPEPRLSILEQWNAFWADVASSFAGLFSNPMASLVLIIVVVGVVVVIVVFMRARGGGALGSKGVKSGPQVVINVGGEKPQKVAEKPREPEKEAPKKEIEKKADAYRKKSFL